MTNWSNMGSTLGKHSVIVQLSNQLANRADLIYMNIYANAMRIQIRIGRVAVGWVSYTIRMRLCGSRLNTYKF